MFKIAILSGATCMSPGQLYNLADPGGQSIEEPPLRAHHEVPLSCLPPLRREEERRDFRLSARKKELEMQ